MKADSFKVADLSLWEWGRKEITIAENAIAKGSNAKTAHAENANAGNAYA